MHGSAAVDSSAGNLILIVSFPFRIGELKIYFFRLQPVISAYFLKYTFTSKEFYLRSIIGLSILQDW